jgi:hypothetical protein
MLGLSRGLRAVAVGLALFGAAALQASPSAAASQVSVPAPAANCDFAAHPGAAGAQFRSLSALVRTAAITLCNEGILPGTADDLFSPYTQVTRAQAVKAVIKLLGVPLSSPQTQSFSDVSVDSPYFLYVETAFALGITPFAQPGGDFSPGQAIERQEFAAVAVDALGDQAAATSLAQKATGFSDDAKISGSYRGDVNEALALGVLTPYTKSRLNPAGVLDRAGFAVALLRMQYQLALAAPASIVLAANPTAVSVGTVAVLTPTYVTRRGTKIAASALGPSFHVTWQVSSGGAQVSTNPDGTANFVASSPGPYSVTEVLSGGGLASPITTNVDVSVFGPAAQLVVTAPQTVVADGVATAQVTATVEDADGNVVADSSAPITLGITSNGAVTLAPGQAATVDAVDGTATFTVQSTINVGRTDTLTVQSPGLGTATALIATAAPVPTSLTLKAQYPLLSVDAVTSDAVSATVLDQLGNPLPEGTVPVTFNLSGVATFTGGLSSETATYSGEGTSPPLPATVSVLSQVGVTGAITVTATAPGLTGATVSLQAVVTSAPAALSVSAVTPGQSASVDSKTPVPAEITVTVVDADGAPVPLNQADALTLTVTPTQGTPGQPFTVGPTGQTTMAAGTVSSAPIPIATTTAGTYSVTVTDSLGLKSVTDTVPIDPGPPAQLLLEPNPFLEEGNLYCTSTTGFSAAACFDALGSAGPPWSYLGQFLNSYYVPYLTTSGAPETVTVQLADANGNAVPEAGVSLSTYLEPAADYFTAAGDQGQATLTVAGQSATTATGCSLSQALSGPNGPCGVSLAGETNAQGQLAVTVQAENIPHDSYILAAEGTIGTTVITSEPTLIVVQNVATTSVDLGTPELGSVFGPTGPSAPQTTQVTANPEDALIVPITLTGAAGASASPGDLLTATVTSGTLVGALVPDPTAGVLNGSAPDVYAAASDGSVTFAWFPGAALVYAGGKAGSATLTVTDDSTFTPVSASMTLDTIPGAPFQVIDTGPNATAPDTVSGPAVVGPFTLTVADSAGNPVVDSVPITLTQAQVNGILNTGGDDPIRTSPDGANLSAITLPAGTLELPVWVEVDASGPVTFGTAPTFLTYESGHNIPSAGFLLGDFRYGSEGPTALSQIDPLGSYTIVPGPTRGNIAGATLKLEFTTPLTDSAPTSGWAVNTVSNSLSLAYGLFGVTMDSGGDYSSVTSPSSVTAAFGPGGQSMTVSIPAADNVAVSQEPTSVKFFATSALVDLAGEEAATAPAPISVTGGF